MNQAQQILVRTFAGGEFAHVENHVQAREIGDRLFYFLFVELSDEEDCENLDTAHVRLMMALDDIANVSVAIEEAADAQ